MFLLALVDGLPVGLGLTLLGALLALLGPVERAVVGLTALALLADRVDRAVLGLAAPLGARQAAASLLHALVAVRVLRGPLGLDLLPLGLGLVVGVLREGNVCVRESEARGRQRDARARRQERNKN